MADEVRGAAQPSSSTAAVHRARSLVQLRRWPEAAAALQPALADPGAGAVPWCLLAQCQLGLGRHKDARHAAGRAIGIDPEQEWAHRLRAIALDRAGKPRRALRAAQEALRLSPDGVHALHLVTMLHLARRRRRTAERLATRNLEQNPYTALAWETAAQVSLARRRWTEAEDRARRGLGLDPHDADLALLLGRALDRQGRRAEAGEAYAAAARSDPTDHRARRALGRIGLPMAAGGVASVKALPFVLPGLLRLLVLLWQLPALGIGLVVGSVLGCWYGATEILFRRASRQLSPNLRMVARRQRRQDARPWLAGLMLVAAALGLRAAVGADWVAVALLTAVLAAAAWLRRALPVPPAGATGPVLPAVLGRAWPARAAHSIRSRLR